jgi:protein-S-isoprenylcysteine O-methyltransferase Ste14
VPIWLRSTIFTLVFPGTVAGIVPWLLITGSHRMPVHLGAARWLGLPLFGAGLVVYVVTTWRFGSAGRGTPAPWDPPRALVINGLHAWVRNPMYLGVLLCIVAEGVFWETGILLPYAAIVWGVFHLRVLSYEEPVLRRLFGVAFDAYAARVPRWLPRRPRPAPGEAGQEEQRP